MESIVEDVEDERETEGSPANSECFKDSGGCEVMRMSLSVYHVDGLSRHGHYRGRHCQAEKQCEYHNVIKQKTLHTTDQI